MREFCQKKRNLWKSRVSNYLFNSDDDDYDDYDDDEELYTRATLDT